MTNETKTKLLSAVLYVSAVFLIVGLPLMLNLWPAGFRWSHPAPNPAYERMLVAIYVSLGICLIPTVRAPFRHTILIDFTILSSVLHAAVMTYDSFAQEHEMMHMLGDVPLLFGLAAVLTWLHPRRLRGVTPD